MLVLLTFRGGGGGVVQNREPPDFRSPEVGRYVYIKTSFCSQANITHFQKKGIN